MSRLELLVIHCTDTPKGREVTPKDLHQWHIVGRGWSRVGYSDLIQVSGKLVNLIPFNQDNQVDPWEISNGAKGFNGEARHVVYAGGYKGVDTRNEFQEYALHVYVKYMILRHPNIKICGHNQISPKKCPGFDVPTWLREIGVLEQNIYKK